MGIPVKADGVRTHPGLPSLPYRPPVCVSTIWRLATMLICLHSLDRLEWAVAEIHDSEAFRRYLEAQACFHCYS
jgi:hypothetical protein